MHMHPCAQAPMRTGTHARRHPCTQAPMRAGTHARMCGACTHAHANPFWLYRKWRFIYLHIYNSNFIYFNIYISISIYIHVINIYIHVINISNIYIYIYIHVINSNVINSNVREYYRKWYICEAVGNGLQCDET